MRILAIVIMLCLVSCQATSTGEHYTQTIQAWRGAPVKNIQARWGQPNKKIIERNGREVWIYQRESFAATEKQYSPRIGVNTSQTGRPVIVQTNDVNNFWNRRLAISCTVMFLVNSKGIITSSRILGNNCVFNEVLSQQLANPHKR